MRILFCNKYNFRFSGTEAYLFDLMDLLQAAGHEVALFAMDHGRNCDLNHRQYLVPKINFKDTRQAPWTRFRQALHAIYSRSARSKLAEAIADFRPEIAHIRNIYHHLSPSILWELRAQGVPVLYQVNDLKVICPTNTLVSRGNPCERCQGGAFWHVLSEGCYAGARSARFVLMAEAYLHKWLKTYRACVTRIVAPTEFVRGKFVENGWDAGNIDVLYHFQNVAPQAAPTTSAKAPILYFGRLSSEKGVADLLRAMRRNPEIPVVIAGEGPERGELERLSSELQLANVRFLGNLNGGALDDAIASSRFTIFPSHAGEVLGKSILESYAHARPVIATDLGSRREMVIDGETGILYRHDDCEELAAKIASLYANPEQIERMGRAGRELLLRRHSPEKHLEKLTGIYERLLGKGPLHVRQSPAKTRTVRVAFIGGRGVVSKYSGIETYYEEVGRELEKLGHEVTVYCRSYFTPPMNSYHGMKVVRLPTLRTKHLETFIHTLLSTVHALFRDFDIIHYHTLGPALFSWMPRLFGKKTIVTVQGLDWQRRKWGWLASAVLRLGERAAVSCPSATMLVSRTLQDYFRGKYGQSTIYIPNGTQLRDRHEGSYLQGWGLKSDDYVLFLGRFSPEKNCDLLVRAFERIDTDVKLVLAGGSSYTNAYIDELRSHASGKVRFLDWVSGDALQELLTNAMLFVLPSDLEGLSLALLDAMGAGICVLASDVPENREVADGAGFTFKAGDEAALSRMLDFLICNPAKRREAGRAGQNLVKQHYLWPDVGRQIEKEYLNLLKWPRDRESKSANAGNEAAISKIA